ncbi:S13-like H2TH domain-containing protein [Phlegmacium glaucopus]|nr:S13-like H2TH domain-containing protein [Phlegmacium glaucopus]
MVHILGINLPDNQFARFALTKVYGIGAYTAHRLCARLQVHDRCKVKDLSPFQVTSLASFLSSPATALPLPRYPLASPSHVPPPSSIPIQELQAKFNAAQKEKKAQNVDPLRNLKIESELRSEIRENIGHQRMIGSYVGRRHAMHLPVRGQNTQNNAHTAKKLNRLDRY